MYKEIEKNDVLVEEEPNCEIVEEVEEELKEIEAISCVNGHVNVDRLNVRVAPVFDADVMTIIKENTEVEVGLNESTDDFYKVYLANGVEGFCMKEFITINE